MPRAGTVDVKRLMYVIIPIANSGAERSFSAIKRVKDVYRAEMLDGWLSALSRIKIESYSEQSILKNLLIILQLKNVGENVESNFIKKK